MLKKFGIFLGLLVYGLHCNSATCTESYDASDFSGHYAIHCTKASVELGLKIFSVEANKLEVDYQGKVALPLPCDDAGSAEPSEYLEFLDQIQKNCLDAKIEEDLCENIRSGLKEAMTSISGTLPYAVDIEVKKDSEFVNRVLGLYSADMIYSRHDLKDLNTVGVINNNDGKNNGRLGQFIAVPLPKGPLPLCLHVVKMSTNGKIDRFNDFNLKADFDGTMNAFCSLKKGDDGKLQKFTKINLSYTGTMEGIKQ